MKVDNELLAKLEKLTSIKVDEDKKEQMKEDISQIIEFVQNLNDIDVSGVEETISPISGGTPFREDIAVSSKEISDIVIKNAPKSENNHFVVPKILE